MMMIIGHIGDGTLLDLMAPKSAVFFSSFVHKFH